MGQIRLLKRKTIYSPLPRNGMANTHRFPSLGRIIGGRLTTFFDYPKDIRRVIYTTNTIESLNASLRKVTSTKRTFPNDDAVFKAIYMTLINTMQKWAMSIKNWKPAMRQFVMLYGYRVEGY